MSSLFGKKDVASAALVKEELMKARRADGPWLHAWHDPVAYVKAFSSCLCLADIRADGEYRLLIADANKTLKVYKGTSLQAEYPLMDQPSALATFYTDLDSPQKPSVAVAAGSHIDQMDEDVWKGLREGKMNVEDAMMNLNNLRESGFQLSSRSTTLLSYLGKDTSEAKEFVDMVKGKTMKQMTIVTCMGTLNKNMNDGKAISSLVIGTENRTILIMDPNGVTVMKSINLPSVPVYMAIVGTYEVEYRIVVACRNGNLYTIKKGKLMGHVFELESQPCGLVIIDKQIMVACMDNAVHSFHFKGKKNYSIYLPCGITNIELLSLSRIKTVKALLVALNNGEVRLYNGKHLVSTIQSNDVVTGMKFGPYGREEGALILSYKSGALTFKMLRRQANLDISSALPGPPPEQDIPLSVPKKTKLFVEQTQREVDQATDMHRLFQRDLCKLRLSTARSFVKIITDGQGPLSSTGSAQLRLDCKVQGLGPTFKLKLTLKNTGNSAVHNIPVTFCYNHEIYKLPEAYLKIPVLVPNLDYHYDIPVICVNESGAADVIRVFVCSPTSAVPSISAIVNMPLSEIDVEEQ